MKVTQVKIQKGNDVEICWLPSEEHRIRVGDDVTLKKGPDGWWKIVEVYGSTDHTEINRKWDVGGL